MFQAHSLKNKGDFTLPLIEQKLHRFIGQMIDWIIGGKILTGRSFLLGLKANEPLTAVVRTQMCLREKG